MKSPTTTQPTSQQATTFSDKETIGAGADKTLQSQNHLSSATADEAATYTVNHKEDKLVNNNIVSTEAESKEVVTKSTESAASE